MLQLRPTFSESWYRVAALKVRLRPSAQISRQYYRGERWYVVRDPAGNQYHRLSDPAYRFVALLDGSRTINEAWELVGGMMDDEAPTQPEVIQILSQLYAANLIEADVTPDSSVLLKRHRNLMKRKFQQRLMNTLFPRIPIWDPDLFLKRWAPISNRMMSLPGAIVWFLVVGLALFTVAPMGDQLAKAARDSIDPGNWAWLWLVFVVTKFIHEMGHAASCRRFGGECHEMGVMFLVFIPTPYVDASSAWSFPSRWARMFVGAAGMTIEIFFAALCALVWANTSPGLPNQLAYNAMLIASVSTVLFNANPLLRYDGYYMLSDYLEIPNLQKKSSEYALGLIKRHLFRTKLKEPLPSLVTRFWLFTYAITSSVYRIFIGITIIILVAFQVPVLGILMSLGGVVTWLGMPLFKSLKYLMLDPELHRKRAKAWAWTGAMVAAVVLLVGVLQVPVWVRAEGVVEPVTRQVVHTETAGFVETVHVKDGQTVTKGDVLLTLYDDQLATQVKSVASQLKAAQIKFTASTATDPRQARIDKTEVDAYQAQLDELLSRQKKLQVLATVSGEVVGPGLSELPGRWLPRGQQLMMVMDPSALVVRSLVTQDDAELIPTTGAGSAYGLSGGERGKVGERTEVRVAGQIPRSIPATSVEVVNAANEKLPHPLLGYSGGGALAPDPSDQHGTKASTKQFELRVLLPTNQSILPGQRAYVRVDLGKKSIAWQAWRRFLQLLQSHSNSKWL